jgi:hypothetical protein
MPAGKGRAGTAVPPVATPCAWAAWQAVKAKAKIAYATIMQQVVTFLPSRLADFVFLISIMIVGEAHHAANAH